MPTPKNGQWLNQPSAKQANQISLLTQEPLCDSTMSPIGEGGIKLLPKPDQRREEASVLWFSFLLLNNRCPVLIKKKKEGIVYMLAAASLHLSQLNPVQGDNLFLLQGPWLDLSIQNNSDGRAPRYVSGRLQTQISANPSASQGCHDMTNGCCSLRPIVARRTQ